MLKPIKSKKDYQKAIARIFELMQKDIKIGSDQADELEILTILVEKYEESKFPIEQPDPIEAIKFRLDQMGQTQTDLAVILGSKSRASELLGRKRKLTLPMIRILSEKLNIPPSSLISDY